MVIHYPAIERIVLNKNSPKSREKAHKFECYFLKNKFDNNGYFYIKLSESQEYVNYSSDSDNEAKSIGIRTEIQATNKEKIKFYAITKLTLSNKLSLITYSEIDHYEIAENNSFHIYEIKTNYLNNSPNASKSIPYFEEKIVKGLDRDRANKETIKRLMGDKMNDEEDFYGYLFQPLALCLKNSIFKIDTIWYKFYFNKEFKCIEIENSDLINYYNEKKVCV